MLITPFANAITTISKYILSYIFLLLNLCFLNLPFYQYKQLAITLVNKDFMKCNVEDKCLCLSHEERAFSQSLWRLSR